MKLTHSQQHHLNTERCDRYENLRTDALFLLMQNIAGEHAELLGCGRSTLSHNHIAWVITRISIRLDRCPAWNSTLSIKTATGPARAGLYRRHFEFSDKDGRIGNAASLWTVIDLDSRTIASAEKLPDVPAADYTPALPSPQKVRICEGEEKIIPYRCRFTDTDINQHINNTAYVRFLIDSLPSKKFATHFIGELDVCYHKELPPESEVEFRLAEQDDRFSFRVIKDELTVFEACGKWIEKDRA